VDPPLGATTYMPLVAQAWPDTSRRM
jgi:hypothetical protein